MKYSACLIALLSSLTLAHAESTPSAWESDIAAFEAHDAVNRPPANACLFVGSSSIRRWTTLAQDFPEVAVINRGFGGSQLSDVADFAERIVVPYRPRLILLYCGDNDIVAGKSPAVVLAEFQAFVAKVRRQLPHTPIAYLAMKPAPGTWSTYGERMRTGNRLIRDHIGTQAGLLYIDVAGPMLDAAGQPRAELYDADREHLNAAGYALWVSIVRPFLAKSEK